MPKKTLERKLNAVKKLSGRKAINSLRKMGVMKKKRTIFISDHIAIEPSEYPAVKKALGEKVCKDNKKRHGKKLVNPMTGRMIQRTKANRLCKSRASQRLESLEREVNVLKGMLKEKEDKPNVVTLEVAREVAVEQVVKQEPVVNQEPEEPVVNQEQEEQVVNQEQEEQVANQEQEEQVVNQEPEEPVVNQEQEEQVVNQEQEQQIAEPEPEDNKQEEVRPEPTMDSRSIMTLEMDDMIQNMDDILGNIQSGIRK